MEQIKKQNGVVNFGKRVGTKAVMTRNDITGANLVAGATIPGAAGVPPGPDPGALPVTIFGFRSALSFDGGACLAQACVPLARRRTCARSPQTRW